MRLFCVATPPFESIPPEYRHLTPVIGNEYTWVKDWIDYDGYMFYYLAEFPATCVYDSQMFATLPSTTEEIAVECEQEAIIYQR